MRRSVVRNEPPSAVVTFTGMSTSPERNAVADCGRMTVSVPLSLRNVQLKMVFVVGDTPSPGCSRSPSTSASCLFQKFAVV